MGDEAVLVTGAMGCIGAWTVRELITSDVPVVAFDKSDDPRRLRQITTTEQFERVRIVQGDITDLSTVEEAIHRFDVGGIVHLGALQLPFCRADPPLGALVNVVGTVNLFEAARRSGIPRVVYTSSIAVFHPSPPTDRVTVDAQALPANHYGVYKLANEGTARAYWADFGLSSVGLRPLTVYGPGRDQGLTSSPTKAILAAVLGRGYEIGFGGSTLFHYAPDVARALVAALTAPHEGATVLNLNGSRSLISDFVAILGGVVPTDGISYADRPLAFPDEIDTSGVELLGPPSLTPLAEGIAATAAFFRDLNERGSLLPEEHGLTITGDSAADRDHAATTSR
jgi:nucleoside-diphosphate-sugar epimerase